jgi:hypothetical protein
MVRALLSLALLGICVAVSDLGRLTEALYTVDLQVVGFAFLLNVAGSIVVPALITRNALDPRRLTLSTVELIVLNFAMRFYVLVLPRAASTALRWYRYKQRGTGSDALALMVFVALAQTLVMTMSSAVFISVESRQLLEHSRWLLSVAAGAFLVALLALLPFVSSGAGALLYRLVGKAERWLPKPLSIRLWRWWEAVRVYHSLRSMVVGKILGLSLLSYVFFVASAYVVADAMDLGIGFAGIAWVRSAVFLLTLVPVSVGGLGVREVSTVAFLGLYGVPEHEAFAFALVMLAVQLMIGLVGVACEGAVHLRRLLGPGERRVSAPEQLGRSQR